MLDLTTLKINGTPKSGLTPKHLNAIFQNLELNHQNSEKRKKE